MRYPSERPPARQTPQTARERAPARGRLLGVHGDGGDGGVHLVAHEICELSHVRHPLLRARASRGKVYLAGTASTVRSAISGGISRILRSRILADFQQNF